MARRSRILDGHKQIGKRFITPFNQMELVREARYVERIMPELLWMDLLNVMFGYRDGIDMTIELSREVRNCVGGDFVNFTVASKFATVEADHRARILDHLHGSDLLRNLSAGLAPLARNYPLFPMTWLVDVEEEGQEAASDLDRMSESVERVIDKYTYAASIIQANVVVFRGDSGALFYAENVPVPDFNAMADDPESEMGQRAATQARIGAMMEVVRDEDETWPKSFWNDNYRLSKCGFSGGI